MRFVWLFAINRTTIPQIYFCSELVCAIIDLETVSLSVMCARLGHNLFISVFLLKFKLNILGIDSVMWVCSKKCGCLLRMTYADVVHFCLLQLINADKTTIF